MSDQEEILVRKAIATHRDIEGPALPILHAVQESLGYIPDFAVRMIAEALNISRAEMHGVVTFYHDFKREPHGWHVLKLCRAEACQASGGRKLAEHVCRHLGVDFGETTSDGRITLEPVYCLGLCASGPAGMIDGRIMGRLDGDKADRVIAEARR